MTPAILALADGTLFRGISIGAEGQAVGEVVFNTAITGYQEILTDPSYARQIVTLTYPHVGNTGCNAVDEESTQVHAAGLVIRDLPRLASNWRSQEPLDAYLRRHGIVAIADIDTRQLTRLLRDGGAQNGCITAGTSASAEAALASASGFPGLKGMDLAKVVSVRDSHRFDSGSYDLDSTVRRSRAGTASSPRFRRQAEHPAHAGRSRLRSHRGAGTDAGSRGARAQARRRVSLERSR
jgi:carbamoyl-phosphate synthase small subunit